MQTTLRIDDRLYRQAKAEAARQGVSLTRFLEEGLRLRLKKTAVKLSLPHEFPLFDSGKNAGFDDAEIRRVERKEGENFYRKKLGLKKAAK